MERAALALGLAAWLLAHAALCRAQDEGLVLDVVRLAHHESPDPLADAAGIHAVLVNGARAHGLSTHAFARSYSRRFFAGQTRRPWALALELDCSRPAGYPGRWEGPRREACLATVALVRSLREPVCGAEVWGSRHDFAAGRFARAHARDVFVGCGEGARNLFARRRREGE